MKRNLDDKLRLRITNLIERWENQVEIVSDDILSYINGYNVTKLHISKDVSAMKYTFNQINGIMKEIK